MKQDASRKLCEKALAVAEMELSRLPSVVGLGVRRNPERNGYRVALYVSRRPGDQESSGFPQSIPVPGSDVWVPTEIVEMGLPRAEERDDVSSPGGGLTGKEPL